MTTIYEVTNCMGELISRHRSPVRAINVARKECRAQGIDPDDATGCASDGYPSIEPHLDYDTFALSRAKRGIL